VILWDPTAGRQTVGRAMLPAMVVVDVAELEVDLGTVPLAGSDLTASLSKARRR